MRKLIHKLRQKPEEERRHLLHIFTAIGAIIMIILWVYSLGKSLSSPEVKEKAKEDLKPFSVLKDNIVGGYKSISELKNCRLYLWQKRLLNQLEKNHAQTASFRLTLFQR